MYNVDMSHIGVAQSRCILNKKTGLQKTIRRDPNTSVTSHGYTSLTFQVRVANYSCVHTALHDYDVRIVQP